MGSLGLCSVDQRLDFVQGVLVVHPGGSWVALPIIMQQYNELPHAQHCNGSSASNLSVQNAKSEGTS